MTAENFDAVIIARHIANLRRIGPLHMRRDYLDKVERVDGKAFADQLRASFAAD